MDMEIRPDYSAEICIRLEAGGHSWPVAKLGPDCFVPAKPLELKRCNGVIVVTIDGEDSRWDVELIDGAVPFDYSVRIKYTN